MELTALEITFYTLGIILMTIIAILMMVSVIGIFYIKHKINKIQQAIEEKILEVTERPQKVAFDIGTSLLSKLFSGKE